MGFKILVLMFACLAIAASAEAQRIEFGPQIAIPLPIGDIGDTELGINAGATATAMQNSFVGFGVDLVYQYWPASPEFKAAFDDLLRRRSDVEISGSTWAFSAFQVTGHMKLVAPLSRLFAPWILVGAGGYRVNRNLKGLGQGLENVTVEPGYFGSLGIDSETSAGMKLGLDASYHHLWTAYAFGSDFVAFTIGGHILFGRQ